MTIDYTPAIVKNTLELEVDTWDDPGDYPSGAGGGPLPSRKFVAGIDGELVIRFTNTQLAEYAYDNELYHNDGRAFDPDTNTVTCDEVYAMTGDPEVMQCKPGQISRERAAFWNEFLYEAVSELGTDASLIDGCCVDIKHIDFVYDGDGKFTITVSDFQCDDVPESGPDPDDMYDDYMDRKCSIQQGEWD